MSYRWLNELSQQFLEKDYLLPGQTLDERVDAIVNNAEKILKIDGFAKKFKENMQKGWYSLSTPVWANFGTNRGLPISCYGSYVDDTMHSILYTQAEVGMMTKIGGGTSAYFGSVRPRGSPISVGGESAGSVHFMRLFDTQIDIVSQGSLRRGSFAGYLDIDHGDIEEFLNIKSEGNPIQHLFFGVCISDKWMQEMIDGDKNKRRIWAKVIQSRINTGLPYVLFIDNFNKYTADVYKDKKLKIFSSNLCTEIALPSNDLESFVCCLASMNDLYFDEWKNTDAVELLTYFLDAVMTEFIEKARKIPFMDRAVRFAERHRAIGIGQLGWHSYLQSKMIPFESMEAKFAAGDIAKTIKNQSYKASAKLAEMFGEPEVLKGYGRRNTTTIAIAPTKSSAFILGQVSEGIEPHRSNYYIKDLAKGKFTIKNHELESLLISKNKNDDSTWESILRKGGSVQHLDFLTDKEKDVFKTFSELSQKEIVIQASIRQKYIDQAQSLNLMIHSSVPAKDISALMIDAWKMGVKSLYYQIGVNAAQNFTRSILVCRSCEA
jgi:ribonucleoside-diphosphate reductase alpha chain